MTPADRRAAWEQDGYFVMRGLVPPDEAAALEAEVIGRIRADPPERHVGESAYLSGADYFIVPECAPGPEARESGGSHCQGVQLPHRRSGT
jgi:hypothetical protein